MKFLKLFHFFLGLSAAAIALLFPDLFLFDNGGYRPFYIPISWQQEDLTVRIAIFSASICLCLSTRKLTNSEISFFKPLQFTAILGIGLMSTFLRYFTITSAIFTALSFLDGILISALFLKEDPRAPLRYLTTTLFLLAFLFTITLFIFSFLLVGQ